MPLLHRARNEVQARLHPTLTRTAAASAAAQGASLFDVATHSISKDVSERRESDASSDADDNTQTKRWEDTYDSDEILPEQRYWRGVLSIRFSLTIF